VCRKCSFSSLPTVLMFHFFSIERAQLAMTETHPISYFSDWLVFCAKGVVPQFANDTNNMSLQVE